MRISRSTCNRHVTEPGCSPRASSRRVRGRPSAPRRDAGRSSGDSCTRRICEHDLVPQRPRRRWAGLGGVVGARGDLAAVLALSTLQIGSTPNRSRCAVDEPTTTAVAGRAPARRNSTPPTRISLARFSFADLRLQLLDPGRLRRRRPGPPPAVDLGLLDPAAQRVRVRPRPAARSACTAAFIDNTGPPSSRFAHQPHRTLPQLLRVLPRCWHDSTFPWNQTLHQTRDDSEFAVERGDGQRRGAGHSCAAGTRRRRVAPTGVASAAVRPAEKRRVLSMVRSPDEPGLLPGERAG